MGDIVSWVKENPIKLTVTVLVVGFIIAAVISVIYVIVLLDNVANLIAQKAFDNKETTSVTNGITFENFYDKYKSGGKWITTSMVLVGLWTLVNALVDAGIVRDAWNEKNTSSRPFTQTTVRPVV